MVVLLFQLVLTFFTPVIKLTRGLWIVVIPALFYARLQLNLCLFNVAAIRVIVSESEEKKLGMHTLEMNWHEAQLFFEFTTCLIKMHRDPY